VAEEQKDEEKKEEKKSNPLTMIVIALLAFLVIIIIVVVLFVFSSSDEENSNSNNSNSQSEQQANNNNQPVMTKKDARKLEVGPMFELDTFIVNLLSGDGRRYLKLKVSLEMEDEDMQEELTAKLPLIKDIIIRIASSQTLEDISTNKGKEKLKFLIADEINSNTKDGNIQGIYFTDFVVQ
jgi:flagellar FliL protein